VGFGVDFVVLLKTTGDTRTVFPYDAILGELFSAETPPPAADAGTKNAFLSPIFMPKTINLSRQARDKHRKS
jgi:hypothetical protein